jgi:ribosomal protection tetracycline resistance protein
MRTLNLGILAHVDAGKTSLTERLLYAAGVIDEIGSVDRGTTQTDSMALERQRGITIKAAVVSFPVGDVTINLIDTPGHPDFIAEVERVLSVLDGAVLVISAVEGVQAQTRVLMRTLQRLRIPTLIFVNKIDRPGAQDFALVDKIRQRLSPAVVPMVAVSGLGTRDARATPLTADHADFAAQLVDVLADGNETLLAAYVDGEQVSHERLRGELAAQTQRALVHPVFFGSAITGAGVDLLTDAIVELLPSYEGDQESSASGVVFKVERAPSGEKVAYARMFSGAVGVRERVPFGDHGEGKITAIDVFDRGSAVRRDSVVAGEIGKIWGLGDVQIGDVIGAARELATDHVFAPPSLETVVVPCHQADKGTLHVALVQLAEQDPLINLRLDDFRQEISVSLYGEVQKEVIQATLAEEFGIGITFRETTTICIERVVGVGAAVEIISAGDNPFLATVGLRVEPGAINSGVQYRLEVELGSMPYAFMKAVEDTVRETLGQGRHGWQVTDCVVIMTHSGYYPRQSRMHGSFDKSMSSTGADFRGLTPLVLMNALERAGTQVCEPMHRFWLEIPADTFGLVLGLLSRMGAVPLPPATRGSTYVIEGVIPAARVHELGQLLPGLTSGEGVLESSFDHYQPVRGAIPSRPRTDHNPLNRKEYLLHVIRRVA